MEPPAKLAVLIDGDNVRAQFMQPLWAKLAPLGIVCIRRLYCRDASRSGWRDMCIRYALQVVQPPACASGKNATDITMVIDALDLAQGGLLDGFCLVSSDSDFTPLAVRLRQCGMKVYGLGEEKAPDTFRQACDAFYPLSISAKKTAGA